MQKRHFLLAFASLALATALPAQAQTIVKIGVTAGPHAQVMEKVKEVAAKDGLQIKIVEFSDFVQPNAALAAGDLEANSYQHKPYLDQQVADRGYKIVAVATSINLPMAVYSKKVKKLSELPDGARIGVPNDPTNGGRALLLLQDQGILRLAPKVGLKATPLNVLDNPKKLRFIEMDAAQLPRSLDDLDASVVNTNYALAAGMNPGKDSIALEGAKSPYVNIIAVREQDKNQPWVAQLVKAYQSAEVKAFIDSTFKGSILATW